jgi:hypothetical protein
LTVSFVLLLLTIRLSYLESAACPAKYQKEATIFPDASEKKFRTETEFSVFGPESSFIRRKRAGKISAPVSRAL